MKSIKKLKAIWNSRGKILEGIWFTWFPNKYVEAIAAKRLAICKSNICGLYDPKGEGAICVVKGSGCCLGCGCKDLYKVHSLSSYCSLKDQGKLPLWEAELTQAEEDAFRTKTGIKNKGQ